MLLRYTSTGYLLLAPEDDPEKMVDAMLKTGYNEEFCLSLHFEPDFVARLMAAGFLVMSCGIGDPHNETDDEPFFILLPKLHLARSVLFFENLHIKKSIARHLGRYELRADADFDRIVANCIGKHGDGWLTPPLVDAIKAIREKPLYGAYPTSFALYRDGELVAGEFGITVGGIYTSYSGYYDENNAGTVQMILATNYLQEQGFAFFDLGMPLNYKNELGAVDIDPETFVSLFRAAQHPKIMPS